MIIANGNGNDGTDVKITGLTGVETPPTAPSFVSDLLTNIKWVAIGAVAGYAACWLMSKRKKK